uniref:Sorting nexin-4-like n=1 Tax=Phallusia mammillata TaxID=59560 RepID=A0A6F9DSP5_9ASCI|nr:sorting nexin-4-like [Phallusia mammillata]
MSSSEDNDLFDEEGVEIPTPVTSKGDDSLPNSDTMLNKLKITVSDPEKRTQATGLKMQETFVVYMIETTPLDAKSSVYESVTSLWRRYSEFELLRNYLLAMYPSVIIPPLPEKRANFIWNKLTAVDTFDVEFLDRRRGGLESFLHRLAGHHKLSSDRIVKHFILKEDGWRDVVMATDYQAMSDSWLRKVNASLRVKQPDIRFDQLKSYANQLQTALSNLLRVRAKLAERVFGIYKIHGNYDRVFKEWALLESEPLHSALQKAASEIEILGKSIDTLIDEEDILAENLKEYLYFADSLKALCKRHEALQYDVEWYDNQVHHLRAEKKQALTGKMNTFSFSGMKARLMGADREEQLENKIEQLDKSITESDENLDKSKAAAKEFLDSALQEIDLFKARKTMDLKEILTNYAILQIKVNKEGVALWSKIKVPFADLIQMPS